MKFKWIPQAEVAAIESELVHSSASPSATTNLLESAEIDALQDSLHEELSSEDPHQNNRDLKLRRALLPCLKKNLHMTNIPQG